MQKSLNPAYLNQARCHISRCYGTSRAIKRELTIYGTTRPHGKSQTKMLWHFQANQETGYLELTKMQKLLESKSKNKNENQNQNENKNEHSF